MNKIRRHIQLAEFFSADKNSANFAIGGSFGFENGTTDRESAKTGINPHMQRLNPAVGGTGRHVNAEKIAVPLNCHTNSLKEHDGGVTL